MSEDQAAADAAKQAEIETIVKLLADKERAARLKAAQALDDDAHAKKLALATARIENEKALQDQRERHTPLAKRGRDAITEKDIAVAKKEQAAAEKEASTSWIPDLSTVKSGTTTIDDTKVLHGTRLSAIAITAAATQLSKEVESVFKLFPLGARLLVTDDAIIVDSDGAYLDATTEASSLIAAARITLAEARSSEDCQIESVTDADTWEVFRERSLNAIGGVLPPLMREAAETLATAVPPIVSLFAVNRTISSAVSDVDGIAAHSAVVHALLALKIKGLLISHDEFRTLTTRGFATTIAELQESFLDLTKASVAEQSFISNNPFDVEPDDGADQQAKDDYQKLKARRDESSMRHAQQDSIAGAIKAFLEELTVVDASTARSKLTTVVMREQLYGGPQPFDLVLLVPKPVGESHQVLSDRTVGWDRLTVGASVALSYMLLDAREGNLIAAGVVQGGAGLRGKVGDQLLLEEVESEQPKSTSWFAFGRGMALFVLGIVLLATDPPLAWPTIAFWAIGFALLDAAALSVQAILGRNRPGWQLLCYHALLNVALLVVALVSPLWLSPAWVISGYLLLIGFLTVRSRAGLLGRASENLAGFSAGILIAAGVLLLAAIVFFPAAIGWLPMALGLAAIVAGLALLAASIQTTAEPASFPLRQTKPSTDSDP